VPLLEDGTAIPFSYPDERLREGERQIGTYILQTPALFDVLDLPLIAGRRFTAAEARDPESRVVIVNDELAHHVWGDGDPIGQRLRLGYEEDAPWSTVIGVVPKIYYEEPGEETDQSRFQVHVPYARIPWRTMAVLIRTRTDPATLADTVRAELSLLETSMAVDSVRTLESIRSEAIWGERLQGELFRTFALLALALSALGIYGVMAYVVSRRTREIGVRMALGADREAIRSLFLRRGLLLVASGTVLGLAGSLVVARLLSSVLYGVRGLDPIAFGIALLVLTTAASIGVALPAERATRVEPVVALEQNRD
jgi:putative ABC transport system permease protein